MAIEITFEAAPTTGAFRTFSEDGFNFTTQQGATLSDVLWSGLQRGDRGTGNFLVNQYSQDSLVLKYGGTKSFGALSFDLDGYRNGAFDQNGAIIPITAAVTFNFIGHKVDNTVVQFSFTTDAVAGWQHVTLPSGFATGLTSLTWTTNAAVEAWGAFDNAALVIDDTDVPPPATVLTAVADAAVVTIGSPTTLIDVFANDADPFLSIGFGGLGATLASILPVFSGTSALGGSISFSSGKIAYTANPASYTNLAVGQFVTDTFYYRALDGIGPGSTGQVTVRIINPGHAPTALGDVAAVNRGQQITVNVLANDSDADVGDTFTLTGFGPNSGAPDAYTTTGLSALGSSVSIVAGKIVYSADAGAFGALTPGASAVDTIYYTVTDSHGVSSATSLTVTINVPNLAPVAVADTAAANNEQTITVDVVANDTDDGGVPTLTGVGATAAAANGATGLSAKGAAVSIVAGKLVYNANAATFDGLAVGGTTTDTVYYTVTDAVGAKTVSTLTVTVTNVNDAPVAVADAKSVVNEASVAIAVLDNDTDADTDDVLSVAGFGATSAAAGGTQTTGTSEKGATVTLQANGQFLYTANAAAFDTLTGSQTTTDSFYYTVKDPQGATSVAKVTVTVSAAAPPPPASPVEIEGTRKNDTLTGSSRNESIVGYDGNDSLSGAGGNDTLCGDDGRDTLSGGEGNDILLGKDDSDRLSGGAGNDTLSGGDHDDTLDGGAGDDLLSGDDGRDTLNGGDGADLLQGKDGDDRLSGDAGHDTLQGVEGKDNLDGGAGNDSLTGGDDEDTLTGGAGNDTLTGGGDDDLFVFGANFGKDVIFDFRGGRWEYDDDHDNRDGDRKHKDHGRDDHDDDRDWRDGGNSGYGYGHGWGNDRDDDDRNGRGDKEWVEGDVIKIAKSEFANYSALIARGTDTSDGVLFKTADGQDTLLLKGVTLSSLNSQDFLFF